MRSNYGQYMSNGSGGGNGNGGGSGQLSTRPAVGFSNLPYLLALDYTAKVADYLESFGGLSVIKEHNGLHKCKPKPQIEMPINGQRVDEVANIALPPANSTDTIVLSYRIPRRYDGVILSLVNYWTGTGFVDGSNDLRWRLQINEAWVKYYGNVQYTLGSLQNKYALEGAYFRLFEGDLLRYYVNHRTGSTLSGGRIVVGVSGYIYPF